MATMVEPPLVNRAPRPIPKKKLVRRQDRDYSQQLRHLFQGVFLALNLYLGTLFYFWVRQFEGGTHMITSRPPGVEGWLPIAGMMNFKYWLLTGNFPPVHPAAMFLLITFVTMAFLLRKAFCSWLCPIGTVSEMLAALGRKIFRRNFVINKWVDIPLRGLKYLLLGFFVYAVSSMSARALGAFMHSPYGLIADVKMLNFFRHLDRTGLIVIGILVLGSALVKNFWCRYLCPYGALLGFASLLSPLRIRRTASACIDCGKCAKACPANLPVDKLVTIKSAECTGCMECVAICPAQGALAMHAPKVVRRKSLPAWAMAAGVAVVFGGIVGYAKVSHHWTTFVPGHIYRVLVPSADEVSHPMPGDEALK
ncbi:MAG TPA: 4Fe-4S binding protein [Terriglobales bacterium]|nr:4Fe-4S binding protein [Terriglobales bacterium]